MRNRLAAAVLGSFVIGPPLAFAAADFPPITDEQWALTEVRDEPNASAVVIYRNGAIVLMGGEKRDRVSSQLVVTERIKILSEDGFDQAEQVIPHDEDLRLVNIQARTVLPGGKVVPVPEDAIFERKSTLRNLETRRRKSFDYFETAIAFPAVEPGAILDLTYEIRVNGLYTPPWWFQDWIPTLHSEVLYTIPKTYEVQPLPRVTFNRELKHEINTRSRYDTELKVWIDGAPAIPREESSFPFQDLSSSFDILIARQHGSARDRIFDGWIIACETFTDWYYRDSLRKNGATRKRATQLTAGASTSLQQAQRLFEFVRDGIVTENLSGVRLPDQSSVDNTLKDGKGTWTEKALLLTAMLEAVKLDAHPVWARSRFAGMVNEADTAPHQFGRMLVAVDAGEGRIFLDPSDKDLAFGRLLPDYEGTRAVLCDPKNAGLITLPVTSHERSQRKAVVELTIDDDGKVTGTGSLALSGHHAWNRIDWKNDEAKTHEAWSRWIEDSFPGYAVHDLALEEADDKTTVRLTWRLEQLADSVLGDEVTLAPSAPLGPVAQPFILTPSKRRTPVLLGFRDRDAVEMRLNWPAGWEVDVLPTYREFTNEAGTVSASIEVDEASRSLVFTRSFDLVETEFVGPRAYNDVRQLYGMAEKNDAQRLVLVVP